MIPKEALSSFSEGSIFLSVVDWRRKHGEDGIMDIQNKKVEVVYNAATFKPMYLANRSYMNEVVKCICIWKFGDRQMWISGRVITNEF